MRFPASIFAFLFTVCLTQAVIHHVPQEFASVQAAILSSTDGDTVLVAEGSYVENINFAGHSIVVGSLFLLDGDVQHIPLTILDGSQPTHIDSGSVVSIISGEDSATALIGFTITGGNGTKFRDQSDNQFYVEGGGIIIENSAPLIAFNIISHNQATREPAGVQSAGGGGIRYGYCAPRIYNNVVVHNSGRYGGGIVSFFADGDLRNNLVAYNDGGQDFGGGGVWIGGSGHATTFLNNTVIGNRSVLTGGGLRAYFGGVVNGHGNVFWDNRADSGSPQINGAGAHLDYSCVQGGFAGTNNTDLYPVFLNSQLALAASSPCVDAGHPDAEWNDPNGTRNDMGCYGGPRAAAFPLLGTPQFDVPQPYPLLYFNCDTAYRSVQILNTGDGALLIDSARFSVDFPLFVISHNPVLFSPGIADSLEIYAFGAGGCVGGYDTLLIYHNALTSPNPLVIPVYLDPSGAANDLGLHSEFTLHPAYPNPFNPSVAISFDLPAEQLVTITISDIHGREVVRLVNSRLSAGAHTYAWNAEDRSSGAYFATIQAGQWHTCQKLFLLK